MPTTLPPSRSTELCQAMSRSSPLRGHNRILKVLDGLNVRGLQSVKDAPDFLPDSWRDERLEPGPSKHVLFRMPENLTHPAIGEAHPSVSVEHHDCAAGDIEIATEPVLLRFKAMLGLRPGGHIESVQVDSCPLCQGGHRHLEDTFTTHLLRSQLRPAISCGFRTRPPFLGEPVPDVHTPGLKHRCACRICIDNPSIVIDAQYRVRVLSGECGEQTYLLFGLLSRGDVVADCHGWRRCSPGRPSVPRQPAGRLPPCRLSS